ncbi:unnamed protein product [Lactuca virosa]|uniref:Uncharacterized protein n=1 Tax=Lactuca virosa TaxID=75947 RepID=A0AAU9NL32_9ASTR|nr:unnamed protein product [Lactuca virosa]
MEKNYAASSGRAMNHRSYSRKYSWFLRVFREPISAEIKWETHCEAVAHIPVVENRENKERWKESKREFLQNHSILHNVQPSRLYTAHSITKSSTIDFTLNPVF